MALSFCVKLFGCRISSNGRKAISSPAPIMKIGNVCSIHSTRPTLGFEEFFDQKKPNETIIAGRAWTSADLRRKGFEDLHKLWFILYKERNLLLTEREKMRRAGRAVIRTDESRYLKVKKSMAGIKHVLAERRKISDNLNSASGEEIGFAPNKLRGEAKPGFRKVGTSPFAHLPRSKKNYNRPIKKNRGAVDVSAVE